jgi:peptide/nickel transport system permease protein
MSIWRYIRRKGIEYVITWYVALTLAFILPRLLPIDPIKIMVQRILSTGSGYIPPSALQALAQQIEAMFGVNKPLWEQYLLFVWNALHLNFGISVWLFGTPVSEIILRALPYDIVLLVPAVLLSWYVGNAIGAWLGFNKRNTATDKAILPIFYALNNAPYFWFALILMWLFASILPIFPATGSSYSMPHFSWTWAYISDFLRHLALPFLSLFIVSLGGWAIGMRQNMLNEVRSNYMTYGESLGIHRGILRRYAYRNAILPQITGLALSLGGVVGGNATLEFTFQYPGIGLVMGNALGNYDYFLMSGVFFFIITVLLIMNFIVDMAYAFIDPRIRAGVT